MFLAATWGAVLVCNAFMKTRISEMAYELAAILTLIATLVFAAQCIYVSLITFGNTGRSVWWVEPLGNTVSFSPWALLSQLVGFRSVSVARAMDRTLAIFPSGPAKSVTLL
jgi:hypothetical protein